MNKWIISLKKKKKLALANTHIFFLGRQRLQIVCFLALANNQSTPTLFLKVEKEEEELVYCSPIEPEKKKKPTTTTF